MNEEEFRELIKRQIEQKNLNKTPEPINNSSKKSKNIDDAELNKVPDTMNCFSINSKPKAKKKISIQLNIEKEFSSNCIHIPENNLEIENKDIDLSIRVKSLIIQNQAIHVFISSFIENSVSDFVETEFIAHKLMRCKRNIQSAHYALFKEKPTKKYKNSELDVYRRQILYLTEKFKSISQSFIDSACFENTCESLSNDEYACLVDILSEMISTKR